MGVPTQYSSSWICPRQRRVTTNMGNSYHTNFELPLRFCHGAVFKCYISQESLNLVGYCFVDDSTIIKISPSTTSLTKETMKLSQEGMDLFSGSDHTTGGQVIVKKTKWYLLEFKSYKAEKWRLAENKADLFLHTPIGPQEIELPPHLKNQE